MSARAPLSITPPTTSPLGGTLSSAMHSNQASAASAVTVQNQAAQLNTPGQAPTGASELWTIPELGHFELEPALNRAGKTAYGHLQTLLKPDGMYVELPQYTEETASDNATLPQATIKEQGTNKTLKTYSEQAILQLYAHNQGRPSIIVDGKV